MEVQKGLYIDVFEHTDVIKLQRGFLAKWTNTAGAHPHLVKKWTPDMTKLIIQANVYI